MDVSFGGTTGRWDLIKAVALIENLFLKEHNILDIFLKIKTEQLDFNTRSTVIGCLKI